MTSSKNKTNTNTNQANMDASATPVNSKATQASDYISELDDESKVEEFESGPDTSEDKDLEKLSILDGITG